MRQTPTDAEARGEGPFFASTSNWYGWGGGKKGRMRWEMTRNIWSSKRAERTCHQWPFQPALYGFLNETEQMI